MTLSGGPQLGKSGGPQGGNPAELVKSLIVRPIKAFYSHVTFGPGMPFKSYEEDVLSRHRNEFEACLLYLRDFMQCVHRSMPDGIPGSCRTPFR